MSGFHFGWNTLENGVDEGNKSESQVSNQPIVIRPNYVRKRGRNAQNVYVSMIARAILSSPEKSLMLCDIYEFISKNYAQQINKSNVRDFASGSAFGNADHSRQNTKSQNHAWKNSVRHNLSSNGCFVKSEKSEFGKCCYWSIHPDCLDDFSRGDYRHRKPVKRLRSKKEKKVDNQDDEDSCESQSFLSNNSTQISPDDSRYCQFNNPVYVQPGDNYWMSGAVQGVCNTNDSSLHKSDCTYTFVDNNPNNRYYYDSSQWRNNFSSNNFHQNSGSIDQNVQWQTRPEYYATPYRNSNASTSNNFQTWGPVQPNPANSMAYNGVNYQNFYK